MEKSKDIIYAYSREMAISDSILIDLSDIAKEAGFKVPVAVTNALYNSFLVPSETQKDKGQDTTGRIWDMLILLNLRCRRNNGDTIHFSASMRMDSGVKRLEMKAMIGPGDLGEPIITIMLPDED